MLHAKHHEGEKPADVIIYALSTCTWCERAKALLDELGVAYDYVDVDALQGDETLAARQEVQTWNPACSFPTIVINRSECIIGFQEERIRQLLGK